MGGRGQNTHVHPVTHLSLLPLNINMKPSCFFCVGSTVLKDSVGRITRKIVKSEALILNHFNVGDKLKHSEKEDLCKSSMG